MKSLNDVPERFLNKRFEENLSIEILKFLKKEGFYFQNFNDSRGYKQEFDGFIFFKKVRSKDWDIKCYVFTNAIGVEILNKNQKCCIKSVFYELNKTNFNRCYAKLVDLVNDFRYYF